MKLLKFIRTRKRCWREWLLTLKMKTMCLYPSLWVKSCQWMLKKPHDRSLPQCTGKKASGTGQMFLWSILGCQAGSSRWRECWRHPSARKAFSGEAQECHRIPDFYPGIVIKNMFKDPIICIFSFRVNPLKGSLILCPTVLTKCFHIFFQLDSLFHFWKILCNYFLM